MTTIAEIPMLHFGERLTARTRAAVEWHTAPSHDYHSAML